MRAHKEVAKLHAYADLLGDSVKRRTAGAGKPVSCGAGCSACCYEPVYAARAEVEHALGRMTPEARAKVKARLVEWLAKVEPSGILADAAPNVFAWRTLRAPCPFLDGQLCTIYQDRPLGCRLHWATGPRENCFDDVLRKHQTYAYSPEALANLQIRSAQLLGRIEHDNLGVWLAEILLRREVPSGAREVIDNTQLAALAAADPAKLAAQMLGYLQDTCNAK